MQLSVPDVGDPRASTAKTPNWAEVPYTRKVWEVKEIMHMWVSRPACCQIREQRGEEREGEREGELAGELWFPLELSSYYMRASPPPPSSSLPIPIHPIFSPPRHTTVPIPPLDSSRTSSTMGLSGHCLCGAVKYTVDAEPLVVGYDHCDDCQRQSGSTYCMLPSLPLSSPSLSITVSS